MGILQDIGTTYSKYVTAEYTGTKGEEVERLLTNIVYDISKVSNILQDNADLEFLLSIVGTYKIGTEEDKLEGAEPPSVLFDDIVIPAVESGDLKVEQIEEEKDGEG